MAFTRSMGYSLLVGARTTTRIVVYLKPSVEIKHSSMAYSVFALISELAVAKKLP